MRILLIEPPAVSKFGNQRIFGGNGSNKSDFRKPPLDLMMISGYLRKEGFDNSILDANASKRTIGAVKDIISAQRPDIVIFSTSTCTIYEDLLVARAAKEVDKAIVTVAVGTHIMALPEETLREGPGLDIAVYSGEWEAACLDVVKNLDNLEAAKGVVLKKEYGSVVRTGQLPAILDLDLLGFPSHDKLEKTLYGDPTSKRYPKTMVMGQKACINNCSFCCQPAFFGAPVLRKRSVAHFIEELKWVVELGYREVMFNDATLTADMSWSASLFESMIKERLDLSWNCSTRVECVKPEILKLMKMAGCHTIALGMESVDKTVLKNIRKNVDPADVKNAVSLIRKTGMDTVIYCVVGFPGETRESAKRTISFLKTLEATFVTLGIAVPAPGTDFYRFVEKNGYLKTKNWSCYDPMKKPVFDYPDLSSGEIEHLSRSGLRQFYLRPSYIAGRLRSARDFKDLSLYFSNFVGFIKRYLLHKSH